MKKRSINRFNKLFPWYAGLSSDLLFWIAVDTLFLTTVKNLSAAQIVSLTSISLISCIILQIPLLNIIKKIGNTNSVRVSSILFLISSILLTFGSNYPTLVIGKILYEIAHTFHNMINAILKNNLELQNRKDDYVKLRTGANEIYAIVTMIISFVSGFMFNINNYLPMICCILFCLICFILSFEMIDYSNNKQLKSNVDKNKKTISKKEKYTKIILFLLLSYGLCFPLINCGQENTKLLIQRELLNNYNVKTTALIIGAILSLSRIIRVISNIIIGKIYKKYQDKIGVVLPILLTTSFCLIITGYMMPIPLTIRILLMSFGYIIILFIRDPFNVYAQNLALNNSTKEQEQTLLSLLELIRKIVRAIISLAFSIILINNPMITVIIILFVLSVLEIIISLYLYNIIKNTNAITERTN